MTPKTRLISTALAILVCLSFLPATAEAKDEWIEVRSKNFFVIGNASEKDIRKVATKLEQFRETFRRLFSNASFTASVPTNVVVFKSNSAYRPFKPKRADGKTDEWIAGYFQSGEDVNYITLSTEGTDADTYGTIFHEYVHFILNTNFGKSDVPSWFNEGLAEYYQTFEIEQNQSVKLGLPQNNHLLLLQRSKMIPLADLFQTNNRALNHTGHSRNIFYAQSWALIHYLLQTNKQDGLQKFIGSLVNNVEPEKAFRDAFQIGYADMEKELRKYIGKNTYQYQIFKFNNPLVFDSEMTARPMSEPDSNAYLGDLLFHIHNWDGAEPFLAKAIAAESDHVLANTTLGMVKFRQRKFADAKQFLKKAASVNDRNFLALYRYAYLLSREGQDDFGMVTGFSSEKSEEIRSLLKKAIAANPTFTEPYELFAYVSLVTGDGHDEAIDLLKTALKYQPGNQRYALRVAEIMARQRKFDEAEAIAKKIAATADDDQVKARADSLAAMIKQNAESLAKYEEQKKRFEEASKQRSQGSGGPPVLMRRDTEMSAAEQAKLQEEAQLESLNSVIAKAVDGQERVIGNIEKIECPRGKVVFNVRTEADTFTLTSTDFAGLQITTFIESDLNEFGCTTKIGQYKAVLVYKPVAAKTGTLRGQLLSIDLVPDNFRFFDAKDTADNGEFAGPVSVEERITVSAPGSKPPASAESASAPPPDVADTDPATARRNQIFESIRRGIKTPDAGEVRVTGTIKGLECNTKGGFLLFQTAAGQLKITVDQKNPPQLMMFTREAEGLTFGCGMKADDLNIMIIYAADPKPKAKIAGTLRNLYALPKDFTLE